LRTRGAHRADVDRFIGQRGSSDARRGGARRDDAELEPDPDCCGNTTGSQRRACRA